MWLNHESDLHLIVYRVYFKQSAFKMANAYIVNCDVCEFVNFQEYFAQRIETRQVRYLSITFLLAFFERLLYFSIRHSQSLTFFILLPPHPPPRAYLFLSKEKINWWKRLVLKFKMKMETIIMNKTMWEVATRVLWSKQKKYQRSIILAVNCAIYCIDCWKKFCLSLQSEIMMK